MLSKAKRIRRRICIWLFYKSNQSERHYQKSNLTQSPEPAATSTNPFLQDAVYDSTGAAQSGEVDKFLYHFYLTVFCHFIWYLTGWPVLWTRIHSSTEWLFSFWPWILGCYKGCKVTSARIPWWLLGWILGQALPAKGFSKGLSLCPLNPNTSLGTSCLWNVI